MLRFLSIARLAIIDALELDFGPGLNVLTGETGAGKSIVVEAVELLLGGRASPGLVRSGEENANVQAILETADGREIIVRRDLTAAGRSRASIDGLLVSAAHLRELTAPLVNLHGQHDHQTLLEPHHHLTLVNRYGGLQQRVDEVGVAFAAWRATADALDALQMDERERASRLEVIRFQLEEIDRVAPRVGEDDELTLTRNVLSNADKLHRLCSDAYADLYERDGAAVETLTRVWKRIDELSSIDPTFSALASGRDSVMPILDELSLTLRERTTRIDASPAALQKVEDRLAALERLKRRHGSTLEAVLARQSELRQQQEALSASSETIADLHATLARQRSQFLERARTLSSERRKVSRDLGSSLRAELTHLAMGGANCELRFEAGELPESQWTPRGIDRGELYLSANPGEQARPLSRIASGGELSRVMLGLKTLATVDTPGKTLIFDEVDAGIGGTAADAVGARLRRLGNDFQVICITHLPQVAAYAHHHYRVAKTVTGERTRTDVSRLDSSGRVEELARMMSGGLKTPHVLNGARELLEARAGSNKERAKGESESPKAKAKVSGRK